MAEDDKKVELEKTSTSTPEPSQDELRAMSRGWKPKEQWEGLETDWVDARTFNDRQSFFDKIDTQNRKIKRLEETLSLFQQHHARVKEMEYSRALQDLKRQKREALKEKEVEIAMEIDEKIDELHGEYQGHLVNQQAVAQQTQVQQGPSQLFQQWIVTNPWYHNDMEMRDMADSIAMNYLRTHTGATESEVFEQVNSKIKKAFPEKFENPNRNRAGAVEGSQGGKAGKKNIRLSDEERTAMNYFVKAGVMTEEKYLEELAATRGE